MSVYIHTKMCVCVCVYVWEKPWIKGYQHELAGGRGSHVTSRTKLRTCGKIIDQGIKDAWSTYLLLGFPVWLSWPFEVCTRTFQFEFLVWQAAKPRTASPISLTIVALVCMETTWHFNHDLRHFMSFHVYPFGVHPSVCVCARVFHHTLI